MSKSKRTICASCTMTLLAAPHALADGALGDIGVRENGGILETFLVFDDVGSVGGEPVERVFLGELGSIEFGPFGIDDPGFFTDTLSEGTTVGFNIRDELKRWDGSTFVGGIGETMTVANFFGTPGQIDVTTSSGFVGGFDVATVSGGIFDQHPAFLLNGAGGDPADGVYLLELEATSPTLESSLPLWVVFNLNRPELEHDEAAEYVEAMLVPGPGSAGVLVMLGGVVAIRRRR